MPEVLQGALNPHTAPRRILCRHPDDQRAVGHCCAEVAPNVRAPRVRSHLAIVVRGRPPRRPFARELAALRTLVRRPTKAAAVTRVTFVRVWVPLGIETFATWTSARGSSSGCASRYARSVRTIALAALPRVAPCA